MKISKTSIVRLITSFLFSLVMAVFVHAYSYLQANFLQYGYKIDMDHLPLLTLVYHRYHSFGYILPALALVVLLLRCDSEGRQELLQQAWAAAVMLVALIWLVSCIIAWQLPTYYPVAIIK
jgi:hypothetical protein